VPTVNMIVEVGRLGEKTEARRFGYEKGKRSPHLDPDLARMIRVKTAKFGIQLRSSSDEEIIGRLSFA
jgi:3-hydroxyacyl-CoA dehydrogenase